VGFEILAVVNIVMYMVSCPRRPYSCNIYFIW